MDGSLPALLDADEPLQGFIVQRQVPLSPTRYFAYRRPKAPTVGEKDLPEVPAELPESGLAQDGLSRGLTLIRPARHEPDALRRQWDR